MPQILSVTAGGGGDVTAAANIDANAVVIGDDGAKGVKKSTMLVSDAGEMTNPSQPAFASFVSTAQTNVTGDSTIYNVTGAFWTDRFDQGSDFSNGTFTAPVTGTYQLNVSVDLEGTTDATLCEIYINTSNKLYYLFWGDTTAFDAGAEVILSGSALVDMDALDTAVITVRCSNGTKIVDIFTLTHFSGFLAS